MNPRNPVLQRGFTLLEAIAVIVIMAIIGGAIAVFVQLPIERYASSVARAEASDLADNALRRMTRDLRLALPNSTRVNSAGTSIEFLQTKTGLRYLAEDDVDSAGGTKYLSWNNAASVEFAVVGGLPTGRHAPVAGDSVVVYNLGQGQEPGNAYDCTGPCNRATIASLSSVNGTITMAANPFAAQSAAGVALMSPARRLHVIDSPVTYLCDPATRRLTRYWGYAIQKDQPVPPVGGNSALLAENVESCGFTYTSSLASQRSGLIGIRLQLKVQDGSGGSVFLMHQVHVDNTP